jgi:hypothetical protein
MSNYSRNIINENITNKDKMKIQSRLTREKGSNKIIMSILCGIAGFIIKTVIDKKDN